MTRKRLRKPREFTRRNGDMSLRWKSPVPKKRRNDGLDAALKMIIYPIAIVVGLLFLSKKVKRRKKRK